MSIAEDREDFLKRLPIIKELCQEKGINPHDFNDYHSLWDAFVDKLSLQELQILFTVFSEKPIQEHWKFMRRMYAKVILRRHELLKEENANAQNDSNS